MRASFFDIDGTLTQGFLMINFSEFLVLRNIFPRENFTQLKNLAKLYFENKISYRKAAIEIPRIYAISLKSLKKENIEKEAKIFTREAIEKFLYPYTKDLLKLMKNYGMTIGISGAPLEVVRSLGEYFNFDLTYGTELEVNGGIYTGRLEQNLVIKETKEIVFEKIIKKNKIDLEKSFGFGDTEQDLPILSKVGNPVVLNPNQELASIAQKNGWTILGSEDDVINEISKKIKMAI